MLIVFALFVDRIQNGHNGSNEPVEKAMAVLTFLLFMIYAFFAVLLIVFQKDIIREGDQNSVQGGEKQAVDDEDHADDLPPENI